MSELYRKTNGGSVPLRAFRRVLSGDVPVHFGVTGALLAPEEPEGSPDLVAAMLSQDPYFIAHRIGGHDYGEFTLAGVDKSIAAGYHALEVSVHQCATGELVCIHDATTARTHPGTNFDIINTPWSDLEPLGLVTLPQVVERTAGRVALAIDPKQMSMWESKEPRKRQGELAIYDYLDSAYDEPGKHVIIKCFIRGSGVPARAHERGYTVMCMLYPGEMDRADFSKWDIVGMSYTADQSVWDQLKATGLPTIAHIVDSVSAAEQARAKGAQGLMSGLPRRIPATYFAP